MHNKKQLGVSSHMLFKTKQSWVQALISGLGYKLAREQDHICRLRRLIAQKEAARCELSYVVPPGSCVLCTPL